MPRDEGQDILEAILMGGMQGFQSGRNTELEMRKEMYKEILKNQLTPREYKPTTMPEALEFETAKAGIVKPKEALAEKKTLLQIGGLEQKQEMAKQQIGKETELIRSTAQDNLNTVRAIKEGKRFFGPYANLPTIATPSTMLGLNKQAYAERKKWENNINKLLSQKVVDLITTMRSASKTGATGFGQLSEKEGQLLREASTALSKDLDQDTASYYLDEMEKIYTKILSKSIIPKSDARNIPSGTGDIPVGYERRKYKDGTIKDVPIGS